MPPESTGNAATIRGCMRRESQVGLRVGVFHYILPDATAVFPPQSVVALDDDDRVPARLNDGRVAGAQANGRRKPQAKMFVFRVTSELAGGGFENMTGRRVSLRHTQDTGDRVAVQGELRLGSGQAELAGVPRESGAAVVLQKQLDALGEIVIVDPMHHAAGRMGFRVLRVEKLDGSRAVFADVTDDAEDVGWGDVEALAPSVEDLRVVRQKSLQERLDHRMRVSCQRERHGEGKRMPPRRFQPSWFIREP